ncbi:DNA/RNA polymerases superfamily protein [Gossypium australe]|uniref:DNA/RNA polymerases superfamily protein n=1 Tax=Gossypium australe TaxID=47621 RepID=A0A5B6VZ82_9ROSI|nr:DNA/RNA polymerases superfamily protein [Gossypium australe]
MIDFVFGFPVSSRKKDTIWVIVNRLTKLTHFILVRTYYSLEKLAKLSSGYMECRYLLFQIKTRDSHIDFKVNFSRLEAKDKQFEQVNTDFERHVTMLHSRLQSSIKMAPFEALYGRKCRTPLYWSGLSESKLVGTDLIRETEDKVRVIHDCQKATLDH